MTMEERLTLYALDALPADEKAAFEAELAASETLRARLAAGAWDFERFLATGKARFEARYMGFDSLGQT